MGHNRLGRNPKSGRWLAVAARLGSSPNQTQQIAATTLAASEARLRRLANDPVLSHSVWLLGRLAEAARTDSFQDALRAIGVDPSGVNSAVGLVARVGEHMQRFADDHPESAIFGDVAGLALRSTLSHAVGSSARGLFGASLTDVQAVLRPLATERRFGELGERFFGEFLSRTLSSFVDREAANVTRADGSFASPADLQALTDAIRLHAYQSARIVREFAGEWFSKHDWESQHQLGDEETARFVGHALRKLRSELKREAALSQ